MDELSVLFIFAAVLCQCNAADKVFGISEKGFFKAVFDDVMADSGVIIEKRIYHIDLNESLYQFIENGLKFGTELSAVENDNVFLFNDLNNIKNGMIQEVLQFKSRNNFKGNITIYLDNTSSSQMQPQDQTYEVAELLGYLDRVLIARKGASIIVDDSKLGQNTLVQVTQKWAETGRELSGQVIVRGDVDKKLLLRMDFQKSDTFLIDLNASKAYKVIEMIEDMGLLAIQQSITIFMTRRATENLKDRCNKPVFDYNYMEYEITPFSAAYINEKIKGCRRKSERINDIKCERNNSSSLMHFDFHTQNWIPRNIDEKPKLHHDTMTRETDLIGSRPTLVASIAGTSPPWVFVQDMDTANGQCGLNGMKGLRLNGTRSITVCVFGFTIDMLRALKNELNINAKIVISRDKLYGYYDNTTGKSTGVVRELAEKAADFGIDITETAARSHILAFSKPHLIASFAFMYVPSNSFSDSGIFKPFDTRLWVGILASIISFVILILALDRCSPHVEYNRRSENNPESSSRVAEESFTVISSITYVWGTLFTGEIITEKPKSNASRVVAIFVSIIAILLVAAYAGNLISFIIVMDETPPITGLLDERLIAEQSTITAAYPEGTAILHYLENHANPKLQTLSKKVKPCKWSRCINMLKNREFDILLYDELSLKYEATLDKDCLLKVISVQKDSAVGVASHKSWTWKRRVDTAVTNIVQSGEADRLRSKWFSKDSCEAKSIVYAIDIIRFKDLFIILSFSMLLCLLLLLLQIVWNKLRVTRLDLYNGN